MLHSIRKLRTISRKTAYELLNLDRNKFHATFDQKVEN